MAFPFKVDELLDLQSRKDEDRGGEVRAACIVSIVITFLSTALRLWSKTTGGKGFSVDDGLIIFTSITAIGMSVNGLVTLIPSGLGRHVIVSSEDDLVRLIRGSYISEHFFVVTLGCVKLAVLAFYYNIFSTPKFRKIVIFSATFVALAFTAIYLALAFRCIPIEGAWDFGVSANAKCINIAAILYFFTITNLVTDLWIFFLPIPIIVRLRVTLAKKVALCGIFLIGLAVCVISAIRVKIALSEDSIDFTWTMVTPFILAIFEITASVLCANLPMVYALFLQTKQALKSFRTMLSDYSSTKSSSTNVSRDADASNGSRSDNVQSKSIEMGHCSGSGTILTKTTTVLETTKAFDDETSPRYVASATADLSPDRVSVP